MGHAGRRTLKWAWIEAAHIAAQYAPRFREFFDRRTNGGKRDRNRGYIAVAHRLCEVGFVVLSKEVDYTDEPPARPGSKACKKKLASAGRKLENSRPGPGQPDRPMVAVLT